MTRRSHRLRVQLTLLYAGPFFVCGALLLSIPLLGASNTAPVPGRTGTGTGTGPGPGVQRGFEVHQMLTASAIGLGAMAVVSLVLGWLIAGRFLRPLRTVTATARDISATNLHRRLQLDRRTDEFTELADTLNDLFGRLEASFESQRHFVANASHELRTPLTAERTLLQVALADPGATSDALRSTCQDVLAVSQQQERLIEALLTLATGEQEIEHRRPFDLADIAGEAVLYRQEEARRRDIGIRTALAPAPGVGDPNLVEILVANLLDNALRHNATGGRVDIETATADGRAGITVRNTGPVVPPGELERLFQPFQRLGGQRLGYVDGHGLGLAIVRAIASAHGATLTALARPDGGLDVEVAFPGA